MTGIDLESAAREMARVAAGVADEHLALPTPCPDYSVAALLDHIVGLTLAFTWTARKQAAPAGGSAPGTSKADDLSPDWRVLLAERLDELVLAWREPGAFEGDAEAGGVTMPAAVMATVALDELVVHGWDLAVSTGQRYRCDEADASTVLAFTEQSATEDDLPNDGIFGPPVAVPTDAPILDRALGFAGRDPSWRSAGIAQAGRDSVDRQ